jgi:Na+/H+-dicarboxylate symporter
MLRSLSVQVLIALIAGLVIGGVFQAIGDPRLVPIVETVEAFGGLWLNALRMTVVPLVFALIVVGIASVADAASTGRLAAKAIGLFLVLLTFSAIYSVLATNGLLALWPVDREGAAALVGGAKSAAAAMPAAPSFNDWIRSLAPSNPLKAAVEDAILPLVVFGVFFGFAATRLNEELRRLLINLFQAVSEAMIVIVRWVLIVAPLGVFALSLGVGLRAGAGAGEVLVHYAIIVAGVTAGSTLLAYIPAIVGGEPLGRFIRAMGPVQAVAFSTQSSLASLPVMVERAKDDLHIPSRVTGLVLPLAVAVFRFTSPVANLAVVFFVAAVYGLQPSMVQIAGAVVVAIAVSVGSVGLPGQISFIASIAPICLALGAPIELLPILLAIEVIPDIFRTLGNTTADMAVTSFLRRRTKEGAAAEPDEVLVEA